MDLEPDEGGIVLVVRALEPFKGRFRVAEPRIDRRETPRRDVLPLAARLQLLENVKCLSPPSRNREGVCEPDRWIRDRVPGERDGSLVVSNRLVDPAPVLEGAREVAVAGQEIGIQRERLAVRVDGVVVAAREEENVPDGRVNDEGKGVELERATGLRDGLFVSAHSREELCVPAMARRVAGAQSDRIPEFPLRRGPLPIEETANEPERGVGLGEVRVELESAESGALGLRESLRGRHRLDVAEHAEGVRDPSPRERVGRVQLDRAFVEADRAANSVWRPLVPGQAALQIELIG